MGKVVKIIGLYFQSLGKKNLIRRKSFGSNFLFKPTIHLFGHSQLPRPKGRGLKKPLVD